jgi:DNA-directed RNA polymerase subunit RPC12/RpoP
MTPRDSFGEFEATSLFCPRCKRATRARQKLLLVLPSGNKYDYVCAECGTAVGAKTDNDASSFHRTVPPPTGVPRPGAPRPGSSAPRGLPGPRRRP